MLTANKIIKIIIICSTSFANLIPVESVADYITVPSEDTAKEIWTTLFVDKVHHDPELLFRSQYILEIYNKNKNAYYFDINTGLATGRTEWNRLHDGGKSIFDTCNRVISLISSFGGKEFQIGFKLYETFAEPIFQKEIEKRSELANKVEIKKLWETANNNPKKIEDLASDLYDLALKYPNARETLDYELSPYLNAKIGQSVNTMVSNNQDVFSKIPLQLQPDNSLKFDPAELINLIDNNHEEIITLIGRNIQFLSEIKEDQKTLLDWINNEPARQAAMQRAQQLEQELE